MDSNVPDNEVALTVVLAAMGRLELADLGFRSWMLQEWDRPYEVVLSLFNDQQPRYEALTQGKNPNCRVIIRSYPKPECFNISAANNLGLHFATGKYVLFANSDIIYPSRYARRFTENMERLSLGYAVGSRFNLSEEQSAAMKPPMSYTRGGNFDFLETLWQYSEIPKPVWPGIGPWVLRRDVATAIGGFDPVVLCSEDNDLTARAVHYMARQGIQETLVTFPELEGFHLYHPTSELFDSHYAAHQIIGPRSNRLRDQPGSMEDQVATPLNDLNALAETMSRTKRPPSLARYRKNTIKKVGMRLSAAAKVLIGRRQV